MFRLTSHSSERVSHRETHTFLCSRDKKVITVGLVHKFTGQSVGVYLGTQYLSSYVFSMHMFNLYAYFL